MSTPTKADQIREPITHELKCHPEPFQAVKRGDKPFEWRKDDRDYRVGDTLWLREWDPVKPVCTPNHGIVSDKHPDHCYTCDECRRLVTYIIREGFGIPEGYCIMGLADLDGGGEVVAWIGPMALRDIERGHDPVVGCEQSEDNPFPLYRHPSPTAADAPPEADSRKPVDVAEVIKAGWPYLQHKVGCRSKSFANSMMSHAPISQRTCTCGLDTLRNQWANATKPPRP